MKKRDLTDIKDVLKYAINENFYKYGFKILLLKRFWGDIVGENLSNYTSPYMLRIKTLYVNCVHQGWISTLQFHKGNILNSIKSLFNEYLIIEDIKFKFGKIEENNRILHQIKENSDKSIFSKNDLIDINKIKSKEDLIVEIKNFFLLYNKKYS